jgi:hypothetical protein
MLINPGQSVAFNDSRGVIWFGIAASSTIYRAGRSPIIKVRVGSKTVHIDDQNVIPWSDHGVPDRQAAGLVSTPYFSAELPDQPSSRLDLGQIISTTEPIYCHGPKPIRSGETGVIIGCVSGNEFIIRIAPGRPARVFSHQITAYRPEVPKFAPTDTREARARHDDTIPEIEGDVNS